MNKITEEKIRIGLDEAYKKAGHNAYFGNGFEAGVKFAEEQFEILHKHYVIKAEGGSVCDHYFPVYSDSGGDHYLPCEFCGLVKQTDL